MRLESYKNVTASVLSICGPSGVGKTTIVKALACNYPIFIETTDGNPHLKNLLEGKDNFDAAANQEWFLERMDEHITHADSHSSLILDQDPAAIVMAYSQMFMEEGRISEAEYNLLFQHTLKIEQSLQRWKSPRAVLFLDAPAEVLRQRVLQRWGKSRTPTVKWFDRIRNHFTKLFTHFPNATTASTVDMSPEQVIALAKSLIENQIQNTQA